MNILENLQHNVAEIEYNGLDVNEFRMMFEDENKESLMDVIIHIENVHTSVEDLARKYLLMQGYENILEYVDLNYLGEDLLHDMSNVLIEEHTVICSDGSVVTNIGKIVEYSVQ